jgi:hypothetical protein
MLSPDRQAEIRSMGMGIAFIILRGGHDPIKGEKDNAGQASELNGWQLSKYTQKQQAAVDCP